MMWLTMMMDHREEDELLEVIRSTWPDPRYQYVTCPKCGQRWQRIDYGCARHSSQCGYPLPEPISS